MGAIHQPAGDEPAHAHRSGARRALRLSTAILIGLAALLALQLVLTIDTYREALEERRRSEIEHAMAIGQTLGTFIDGFVHNVESTVLATASALSSRSAPLNQTRDAPYIRTVLDGSPALRALFVTDTAGKVIVARDDRETGVDLSGRPYIQALRGGSRVVWSDLLYGIQTGSVTVAHGRQIRAPDGRLMGFAVAAFFPERVLERVPVRLPEDARVTLVDRRGFVLFSTMPVDLTPEQRDFSTVPEVQRALRGETVIFERRTSLQSGEERFGVIVPVPQTGWAVSFTRPVGILPRALGGPFRREVAGSIALTVIVGLVAGVFVLRLTRPLGVLASAAAAVARGERPRFPQTTGLVEVSQLAQGMEAMGRAVAEREDALRRALAVSERLHRLSEAVGRSASLEEIYEEALDALRDTLGAERASILLYDQQRVMRFIAWRGLSPEYRRAVEGHAPWAPDDPRPQPVVVPDVDADPELAPLRPVLAREGIAALAFIPLLYQGKLMGKFMAYYAAPRALSGEEIQTAESIAANVAFAIQRRRAQELLAAAEASERSARLDAEDAAGRLTVALAAGNMGTWDWDVASGRVRWSESLEAIHGMAPGTFAGTFDAFDREIHPADRPTVQTALRRALELGEPYEVEYRITTPAGQIRWLAARGKVIRDGTGRPTGMTGVCLDVTARKQQEEERTRLLAQEQAARTDAEGARGRLAFLAEASALMAASLDHATILRHLAHVIVPRMADWSIVYGIDAAGTVQRLEVVHTNPEIEDRVRATLSRHHPEVSGPPAEAMRTGRTVLIDVTAPGAEGALSPHQEIRRLLGELGVRALMVVPLIARGRTLGAILFASSGRPFGAEDVSVAEDLSRRAAGAVDNALLYERERGIAQTLQQAFLPASLPHIPGLVLHATYLPGSGGTEIGGDWYDAFWMPSGVVGISIGDVTGHGVDAAVVMGQVRQGIRAAAWDETSPAAVLSRASRLLHLLPGEEMATALFGVLDPVRRTFTYASAGHPAPVLAAGGGVEGLPGGGLPLGMRRATEFQEWTAELTPGALLVLYTDGLIEFGRNPVEGERLLLEAVRAEAAEPSADRAGALQARVLLGTRPPDDVAVITLSATPLPVGATDIALPAIPAALPLARQAIRYAAEAAGLSPRDAEGLVVAACEAVNNVIEHAYSIVPGEIRIHAAVEGSELVVLVEDSGQWRPPRPDGGGRGMGLMRAFADRVEIERTPRGTRVRLAASLSPAGRPAS